MADTMRAALDDGTGRYVVQDVPIPEMYPGAAMIRIRQTGICGSDLHMTTSRTEAQTLASVTRQQVRFLSFLKVNMICRSAIEWR